MSRTANAQRAPQVRRIGWLVNAARWAPADFQAHTVHLRALGWTEGRNLMVEQRYTSGNANLLPTLAEELVRLKVETIVAEGTVVALGREEGDEHHPNRRRSVGRPCSCRSCYEPRSAWREPKDGKSPWHRNFAVDVAERR